MILGALFVIAASPLLAQDDSDELELLWADFEEAAELMRSVDPPPEDPLEVATEIELLFDELSGFEEILAWDEMRQRELCRTVLEAASLLVRGGQEERRAFDLVDRVRAFLEESEHSDQLADYEVVVDRVQLGLWKATGHDDLAEQFLQEKLRQMSAGDPLRPTMTVSRAEVLYSQGRWLEVLDVLEHAEHAFKLQGDADQFSARVDGVLFRLHVVRAQTLQYGLRLYDPASDSLDAAVAEAEDLFEKSKNPALRNWEEQMRSYSGRAATLRNDFRLMCSRYQEVVTDVEARLPGDVDARLRAHLLVQLARAQLRLVEGRSAELDPALESLRQALSLGQLSLREAFRAELVQAEALWLQGSGEEAAATLGKVRERLERVGRREARQSWMKLAVLEAAFLREREDASEPERRAVLADLESALELVLEEWDRSADLPGGTNFLHHRARRELIAELLLCLGALNEPTRAVELLARVQAQGSLARRNDLAAPTVDELLESVIPEGWGLVSFVAAQRASVVVVVDHSASVSVIPLPPTTPWFADLKRLHREVRRRPTRDTDEKRWRELALLVGDALFPPSLRERTRGWTGWIVDGATSMDDLAVEVLQLSDDQSAIGLEVPICYVPSLPVGFWVAHRPPEPDLPRFDYVLVQGPHRDASGAPLDPHDVSPLLAGWEPAVRWHLSTDELLQRPKTAAGVHTGFLHVLTHGAFDSQRNVPAGLVLDLGPPQRVLWAEELHRLPTSELVLLSACGAARGLERLGEDGLTHLGGQMLERGARAVLLASCQMEDTATLLYARELEEALRSGQGIGQAHLASRREVAASPGRSHPYYWANLRLLGDGQARGRFATPVDASIEKLQGEAGREWRAWALLLFGAVSVVVLALLLRSRGSRSPS